MRYTCGMRLPFPLHKTQLLAVFTALCVITPAVADFALQPQANTKPTQWIEYALSFSGNAGLERNRAFGSLGYRLDLAPYEGTVGFQSSGKISDITLSSTWWLVRSEHRWRTWEFGVETLYHYQHYEGVYGEHDLLLYYCMRQRRDNGFEFVLKNGGTLKAANLYVVDEIITNKSFIGAVQVGKTWQNGFELYTSVASHDRYRYPLFFSPRFIVGSALTLGGANGCFRPSLELEAGFTDFFTTAVYVDTLLVRIAGSVRL